MNDVYIVEITSVDDYVYERYKGEDEIEARKIYNEFTIRKNLKKVELYKKIIIEITQKETKLF